jgi:phage baseplate assembly protein gpV
MFDLAHKLFELGRLFPDPNDVMRRMLYRDPKTRTLLNFAIVEDNQDPDGRGRLRVRIVTLNHDALTPWIPIIRPFTGKNAGFFVLPDIGEQVLVVHINGNPSHPLVLASMYTPRNGIDPGDNKGNVKKFFRSRSGAMIEFNDTEGKETLSISTKNGEMFLALDPKGIRIHNTLGNIKIKCRKLTIQAKELSIKSSKTTTISSEDKLSLKSSKSIVMKASNDVKMSAKTIKLTGYSGVTAGKKQIAVEDDQVVGVDIHNVNVPAGTAMVPTPIPHPYLGKLDDKLSPDVEIQGKKVATKGSKASFIAPGHQPMPPGTSFVKTPNEEAEITGGCCSSVKINDKEACTLGSTATSCNDVGMQDHSTVIAMGMPAILPIMMDCIDERTYKQDGGFMINTRDLISNAPPSQLNKKPSLNNPRWSSSSAKIGEELSLEVSSTDLYEGAAVYFEIWQEGYDPQKDKPLAKKQGNNKGGKAKINWTWYYRESEWPKPFTEKPKFVFTAGAFKCKDVESSAVEMGMDVKIEVLDTDGEAFDKGNYELRMGDTVVEGSLSNGMIEETDLIPGEYTLFLTNDKDA